MANVNVKAMVVCAVVGVCALAGCTTEAPDTEDVVAAVEEPGAEAKSYLGYNMWDCAGATAAQQKKASQLVKYAFGANFTFPAGAACANVKGALDELRVGLIDGSVTVEHTDLEICDIATRVVKLKKNTQSFTDLNTRLETYTDACFGQGVLAFLVPFAATMGAWGGSFYMDPEPATLTANLTSTQGAAASAYWNTSLEATRVKKWGATFASCGSAVAAGEACSTTALAIGQVADRMVQKNGTLCRCL